MMDPAGPSLKKAGWSFLVMLICENIASMEYGCQVMVLDLHNALLTRTSLIPTGQWEGLGTRPALNKIMT